MSSIRFKLRAILALYLAVFIITQLSDSHSIWPTIKDNLIQTVCDKIISSSSVMREFNNTVAIIKRRYEEAEEAGLLEGKDDVEKDNYYRYIAADELRLLKGKIAPGQVGDESASAGPSSSDKIALETGYDPYAMVKDWEPDAMDGDMTFDSTVESENFDDEQGNRMKLDTGDQLRDQLEKLKDQASKEDKMGWSLTPEARDALQRRTRAVLYDLFDNELRQIAVALLSTSSFGSNLAMPIRELKFKIIQYLINGLLDIISGVMGRKIRITSPPDEQHTPTVPVSPSVTEVVEAL